MVELEGDSDGKGSRWGGAERSGGDGARLR